MRWTDASLADQSGKSFLVTGANSGLGLETSRVLARQGAKVIMACRNVGKAEAAAAEIKKTVPNAQLSIYALDLSDLESVKQLASRLSTEGWRLDGLINNAGLMAIPFARTKQGLEMQLGTNHFGHFALTARLFPLLTDTARVVSVSSEMHRAGRASLLEDPEYRHRSYSRWLSYGDSKLANLLFMYELHRRLHAHGSKQKSLAAHPGYAATELQGKGASLGGPAIEGWVMNLGNVLTAQSALAGAWPQLRAATDPEAQSGQFYGPAYLGLWGPAVLAKATSLANNAELAAKFWSLSVEKTGVSFPF